MVPPESVTSMWSEPWLTLRGLALAIGLAPACTSLPAGQADAAHGPPAWSRDAVIYEVNVRQYTPEGTFAALQEHLPRLDALGVDILWLMPIQPIGRAERKGSLGSYYSVADYTAVNAEFGTEADFATFVDAVHAHGMKVILDWVANHTAFDHPWTVEHPDFYTRRPDGSISVAIDNEGRETDWTDVADLDFDNREMRRAMIAEMRWWLDTFGIDGFRCDVAGFIPYDFWDEVHTALTAADPELFMLAEWEDPALHEWFDMTYGWEFHHLLNLLARGEQPVAALDEYLAKHDSTYPPDAYRMYFTTNHDENSWNGSEFERMGANHAPAFILSATFQNSMPLIYTGQEAGLSKRLRFFEKDTVAWTDTSWTPFYRAVVELRHTQEALRNGEAGGPQARLETQGGERVYAFTRTRGSNTVLVAVNFADAPMSVTYDGLARPGEYVDWFNRRPFALAETGSLDVPANGYRVLVR